MMKQNKMKRFWKIGTTFIIAILSMVTILFLTLIITEYKPAATEDLSVHGTSTNKISKGDSLTIMTWNIGFGALGDYADFFMDGGKQVTTSSKKQVKENLSSISNEIKNINPNVIFLQEVDQNSKRSYHYDETSLIQDAMKDYQYSFANNFKVLYLPYPVPPIGKVDSGIMTLSNYEITSSMRYSLPCPFSFPMRIANLKRCIMIDRVAIEDSENELVLVNLHLEAYDDGSGKEAQTAMLRQILQTEVEKGNYVIAGGDFNQSFSNIDISQYPVISEDYWTASEIDISEFGNDFQFVMDNQTPTCRSLDKAYVGNNKDVFQFYMIDGFIVSSNLTVNSIETKDLEFKNSDHNPVVINATLKEM